MFVCCFSFYIFYQVDIFTLKNLCLCVLGALKMAGFVDSSLTEKSSFVEVSQLSWVPKMILFTVGFKKKVINHPPK